jgi:glycosyltransferase involved in cell wall biosynthesis
VTPSYLPILGGSETLTHTLSIGLNEAGVQTDVMAFNMDDKWKVVWSEKTEKNSDFKVFKVPALKPFPFISLNPLYYPLRINVMPKPGFKKKFEDYDIIHFLGEADLSFPIFSLSVRKPKIMHCVGISGLEKQFKRHTTMRELFVRIFPRVADLYLVFSPEEKNVLLDLGIPENKVLTLHYGVDTEIFRPDESKKLANLILFVGRIDPVKGLHVLLKSLSYLDFKTQVAIIGPATNPKYFMQIEKMRAEINKQGVHNVSYLGQMDPRGLVPWYQKATVLARPDLVGASGEGCSTLEALACGTPVIGVTNHVVINDFNGWIIPPNDPIKLAEALRKVLTDKELREKCGKAARKRIEQEFSMKSAVMKLVKIYEDLLNRGEQISQMEA